MGEKYIPCEEFGNQSPVNKVFRVYNAYGIANNLVLCDEALNIIFVTKDEQGVFELQGYAGRFSDELFRDGIRRGVITDIVNVEKANS